MEGAAREILWRRFDAFFTNGRCDLIGGVPSVKQETIIKLAVFNVIFVIAEVVMFSRGLGNLASDPLTALVIGAASLAAFIGVNYWILVSAGKRKAVKTDKLKNAQDYREALESWQGPKNPFNNELREAIHQLDLYYQKQTALKALLGDQAKEPGNPFLSVSEDVQGCLFSNMKKLLNRMTILDPEDHSKMPLHTEFIHHVLGQNKQLLSQYDNLIIEISQIGDSKDLENLHLENITDALRELRNEQVPHTEMMQELMQQGGED